MCFSLEIKTDEEKMKKKKSTVGLINDLTLNFSSCSKDSQEEVKPVKGASKVTKVM